MDLNPIHGSAFKGFEDIANKPGFYLNVITGDIYKNNGRLPKQTKEILKEHDVNRPMFLLISGDLELSNLEVKSLAVTLYGVSMDELGKVVDNDD